MGTISKSVLCITHKDAAPIWESTTLGHLDANSKPGITIIYSMSFQNKGYEKETELSKYVWNLKDKGEDFSVK